MNQIITQHGWGLDSSSWSQLRGKFNKKFWSWKDNDRGYFNFKKENKTWTTYNSQKYIKLAICHSLGTYLINPQILNKASHVVLINSFKTFIPKTNQRDKTIRILKRMEENFESSNLQIMLQEFLNQTFLPNLIDKEFQKLYKSKLSNINATLLLDDFRKLYIENKLFNLLKCHTKILIIKSKSDLILNEESCDDLINTLKTKPYKKTDLIELSNEGHFPNNQEIFEIITEWLSN